MAEQLSPNSITFEDHCDPYTTRGVRFDAFVEPGQRTIHCTVSDEALMADYGWAGPPEAESRRGAYMANRGAIQATARWKIRQGQFEQGSNDRVTVKSRERGQAAFR
jgi:hypothetical protein